MKGLANVAAYLDDIVLDPDPSAHVLNIKQLFKQLRKHNLKLSPSEGKIGATDAYFLGHAISPPREFGPTLAKSLPSRECRYLWYQTTKALLGGLSCYRKFLANMAEWIQPIALRLKQGSNSILRRPWRPSYGHCSRNYRCHRFWSTLTGMWSPTTPVLSSPTATPVSMVLEPPSSRNKKAAQSALLFS